MTIGELKEKLSGEVSVPIAFRVTSVNRLADVGAMEVCFALGEPGNAISFEDPAWRKGEFKISDEVLESATPEAILKHIRDVVAAEILMPVE